MFLAYTKLALVLPTLIALRFLYLIYNVVMGRTAKSSPRSKPSKTIICIGSGGHTTEMLHLTQNLDATRYTPRIYLVAKSDTTSTAKVKEAEGSNSGYLLVYIPRSRAVGQSYATSIFTTLYSVIGTVPIMVKVRPDLVLCNGPGTCIPVCLIAILMKAMFVCDPRIVFVESFCRTQTFSLTGKILAFIADNVLVQWPELKRKFNRADYIGQLM